MHSCLRLRSLETRAFHLFDRVSPRAPPKPVPPHHAQPRAFTCLGALQPEVRGRGCGASRARGSDARASLALRAVWPCLPARAGRPRAATRCSQGRVRTSDVRHARLLGLTSGGRAGSSCERPAAPNAVPASPGRASLSHAFPARVKTNPEGHAHVQASPTPSSSPPLAHDAEPVAHQPWLAAGRCAAVWQPVQPHPTRRPLGAHAALHPAGGGRAVRDGDHGLHSGADLCASRVRQSAAGQAGGQR